MKVELTEEQWRQVIACLAETPWKVSNPLIMAIGGQMQAQTAQGAAPGPPAQPRGNSGAQPGDFDLDGHLSRQ